MFFLAGESIGADDSVVFIHEVCSCYRRLLSNLQLPMFIMEFTRAFSFRFKKLLSSSSLCISGSALTAHYSRIVFCFILFTHGVLNVYSQANKVVVVTEPIPGRGLGQLMPVQPVVEITDASNQRVTTSTAQVQIKIASGNGGVLGGTNYH